MGLISGRTDLFTRSIPSRGDKTPVAGKWGRFDMRLKRVRGALAGLSLSLMVGSLMAGGIAHAQDDVAPVDIEDSLVSELIVKAARPGPAFWQVSDADSTVWVMGVPNALPKDVAWNHDELKRRLTKANVLIVGTSQWRGNIFSLFWMLLTGRDKFRAEAALSQTLPPDMYTRFQSAWRGQSGRAPDVGEMKPVLAALGLSARFQRELDMQRGEPEKTIRREALFRVPVQTVGDYNVVDFLKLLQAMPRETELACMEDALRQVEAGADRAREAARGWARGDLRVAISAERGWERCIASDPQIATLTEQNIAAATDAIRKALDKPGHAVALIELRPLLAQNGVLVRLKAEPGLQIAAPDAPGVEVEP